MKKIVHISIYPPKGKKHAETGGVASYAKNLVTSLQESKQYEQFVLSDKIKGQESFYQEEGISIFRVWKKGMFFLFNILKKIKKLNPETIHFQQELSLYGNILTAYLLQWGLFLLQKYNTIVTLHGIVSLKKIDNKFVKDNNSKAPVWLVKFAFKIIYKPLCRYAKKIIVHEKLFKDILVEEYGVSAEKIFVIHHGIEMFNPISKKEASIQLDINSDKDIVLYMGYLTGYKGLDILIEGFSRYSKINPNAFLILGAGKHPKLQNDEVYLKEYSRLQNKARKLIPVENYMWEGFIKEEDITAYYCLANVSIYPYTISMASSGPMSIAIGHEKPFLLSDVFSETFNDPDVLFDRNANSLCDKLDHFFSHEDLYKEKSSILKKERSWKVIAEKTGNIY